MMTVSTDRSSNNNKSPEDKPHSWDMSSGLRRLKCSLMQNSLTFSHLWFKTLKTLSFPNNDSVKVQLWDHRNHDTQKSFLGIHDSEPLS